MVSNLITADENLARLQLQLPPAPKAVGVYRPAVHVGNLLYTSGHLPILPSGQIVIGCVGDDADEKAGYAAARQAGMTILATLKQELGSLNRIRRLVKLFGLVNCTSDFYSQPAVVNGCSELFRDVFGDENGIGARSAVGANSLPLGAMVEIEAIFETRE